MGDIPDPILNCVLEICCGAPAAQEGLARLMARQGMGDKDAKACAEWMLEYFDLAPKGSLVQLKADIARMARG